MELKDGTLLLQLYMKSMSQKIFRIWIGCAILERADAREIARRAGCYATMMQDGLAKAAQGLTTIDEVLRVTQDG